MNVAEWRRRRPVEGLAPFSAHEVTCRMGFSGFHFPARTFKWIMFVEIAILLPQAPRSAQDGRNMAPSSTWISRGSTGKTSLPFAHIYCLRTCSFGCDLSLSPHYLPSRSSKNDVRCLPQFSRTAPFRTSTPSSETTFSHQVALKTTESCDLMPTPFTLKHPRPTARARTCLRKSARTSSD